MFETCKRILFMDTVVGVKSTTAYIRMINTEFRVLGCCCTTPGSLIHIVCQRIVFQGEAFIDWKGGRSIQGASVVPIMYNFLKVTNKKKWRKQGRMLRFDRTGWWAHRCLWGFSVCFSAFLQFVRTKHKWAWRRHSLSSTIAKNRAKLWDTQKEGATVRWEHPSLIELIKRDYFPLIFFQELCPFHSSYRLTLTPQSNPDVSSPGVPKTSLLLA